MWKSATAREAFGSNATSQGPIIPSSASPRTQPTARFKRLPIGSRLAAGSPFDPASNSGFKAVPRLAPRTSAKAACGGTTPCAAKDMISSTTATLECAAQVDAAATITAITGTVAIAPSSSRRLGTSS